MTGFEPLVLEATTLPTESQPCHNVFCLYFYVQIPLSFFLSLFLNSLVPLLNVNRCYYLPTPFIRPSTNMVPRYPIQVHLLVMWLVYLRNYLRFSVCFVSVGIFCPSNGTVDFSSWICSVYNFRTLQKKGASKVTLRFVIFDWNVNICFPLTPSPLQDVTIKTRNWNQFMYFQMSLSLHLKYKYCRNF